MPDYGPANIQRVASHFTESGVHSMIDRFDICLVAELDGCVIGTASLVAEGNVGRVRAFFVDPVHQGCGAGAALYRSLRQAAPDLGVTRFSVRSSLFAVQFYKKMGFVEVQELWHGDERTVEMRN
ncbi:GNAT family N-acetyltransferase [Yoonia sp. 2307UL14-13]|uniref:GNAT family N-acetyltransferase n=1 Tax=Yoonia sp. 2307UL14-13 TaxID=3126506 RepID=UPI0040401246